MADLKISALPASTTPLAGTEVLPVVQGGTTKKVAVSDLTAGRAVAFSSFTSTGGNVMADSTLLTWGNQGQGVQGVNSGGILRFYGSYAEQARLSSAGFFVTNGDVQIGTAGKGIDFSANTNAPGMTSEVLDWYEEGDWTPSFTGWSANPTTAYAKYTRIGRVVYINAVFLNGTTAGGASIGGLPFSSGASNGSGVSAWTVANPSIQISGQIATYASSIANINAVTISGDYWCLSVFYLVD